jgi:hypothetical protein
MKNCGTATISTLLAAVLLVGSAGAEGDGSGAQTLTGFCASNIDYAGITQECLGPQATPDLRFTSAGSQFNYSVTFTAPATHCSKVAYHVHSYDLSRNLGATGLLSPGQSQTISIGGGYAAGLQIAKVKAYGWIGGCNAGVLQSWAATVTVQQR